MYTFRGGVHPFEGKDITEDKVVIRVSPKGEMVFAVDQHIGSPSNVCVNVGDAVKKGQIIAEPSGFISANILSSVSGKVKAIEDRLSILGTKSTCIVIENDNLDTWDAKWGPEKITSEDAWKTYTRDEIIEIVKDAGIVGLGGAAFPTHIKLNPKNFEKIDTVLINGAECEPYLTSDYRDMIESKESLICGCKILQKVFPNAEIKICIEDNKPKAIEELTERVANEEKISVVTLKTKYPQGGERQLIYAVTKRKINSKKLPAEVNVIVDNIGTVIAIYDAVVKKTPLLGRVITCSGDAFLKPGNYYVPCGMNYLTFINEVCPFVATPKKIINGGTMMGIAIASLDAPISKKSNALLAFLEDDEDIYETTPCINCKRCMDACPANLMPMSMMRCALALQYEEYNKLNGLECMECGCCTYVCPAKRPLTQNFKMMKKKTAEYLKTKEAGK